MGEVRWRPGVRAVVLALGFALGLALWPSVALADRGQTDWLPGQGELRLILGVPRVMRGTQSTQHVSVGVISSLDDVDQVTVEGLEVTARGKSMSAFLNRPVPSSKRDLVSLSLATSASERDVALDAVRGKVPYATFVLRLSEMDPAPSVGETFTVTVKATLKRNGESITLSESGEAFVAAEVLTMGGWVAGDGHIHTRYSDGAPWLEVIDQAQHGRHNGLDWVIMTDHWDMLTLAEFANEGRDCLAASGAIGISVLRGEELSGTGGDLLAYDAPFIEAAENHTSQSAMDAVRDKHGFGIVAHPFGGGSPWNFGVSGFTGMEVFSTWSSPSASAIVQLDEQSASRCGHTAVGNSDDFSGFTVGSELTYVNTGGSTSESAIYTAMKAGRTVASNGPLVAFTMKGVGIGGTITPYKGEVVPLQAQWPAGVQFNQIRVVVNGSASTHYVTAAEQSAGAATIQTTLPGSGYVRIEASGSSGQAITSPIFVNATGTGSQIDVAFVIDTTYSMWDDIAAVKAASTEIVNALEGTDCRVAIVDYRDYPVWPYGWFGDYPYHDVILFTQDRSQMRAGIQSLSLGDGADWRESVYSALLHTIDGQSLGSWRPQPNKFIILMGDAPPHDPEPFKGYTVDDVLTAAYNADPITIYPILVGGDPTTLGYFTQLADGSGGKVFTAADASQVAGAVLDAIGDIKDGDSLVAALEVQPKTLNVGSQGECISAHITFLDEVSTDGSVQVTELLLNGVVPPAKATDAVIIDRDRNKTPEVFVKFDRGALAALLSAGDQTLMVTGKVNGRRFQAIDVIKVIDPGHEPGWRLKNE